MQVNTHVTVGEYVWILKADPALEQPPDDDKEAQKAFDEKYRLYCDTRDESHLPIRAGQEPVRWQFRHATGRVRQYLVGKVVAAQRDRTLWPLTSYILCQHALIGGNPIKLPTGGDFEFAQVVDPDTRAAILSEDTLDKLDQSVDFDLMDQLSSKIVEALFASPLS